MAAGPPPPPLRAPASWLDDWVEEVTQLVDQSPSPYAGAGAGAGAGLDDPYAPGPSSFYYQDPSGQQQQQQQEGRLDPLQRRVACAGLVLFGAAISALGKLAYETEAAGRDGAVRPFEKPWCMVLLMFVGMALNLPLSLALDVLRGFSHRRRRRQQRRRQQSPWGGGGGGNGNGDGDGMYTPLMQFEAADGDGGGGAERAAFSGAAPTPFAQHNGGASGRASGGGAWWEAPSGAAAAQRGAQQHEAGVDEEGEFSATLQFARLLDKQLLRLLVPTLFELAISALLNVGLLAVTASAAAMLRQSLLLFAGALGALLYGRRRLSRLHAAGMLGCAAGVGIVAAAAVGSGFSGFAAPRPRREIAAGAALVVASQLLAAAQLALDQPWWLPAGRLRLSPLKIVGAEGVLGALLTLFVVMPIAASTPAGLREGGGLREDFGDTLAMLASRPLLVALLLCYTGCLQAYNLCGMVASGELRAVDTTLLQALRTLLVWAANLALYAAAAALAPPSAAAHGAGFAAEAAAAAAAAAAGGGAAAGAGGMIFAGSGGAPALPPPLPGEPWMMPWSLVQAAGFAVLVGAALVYSRGDTESLRQRLADEAALVMLDAPPPAPSSIAESAAHAAAAAAAAARSGGSFTSQQQQQQQRYHYRAGGGGGGSALFSPQMEMGAEAFRRGLARARDTHRQQRRGGGGGGSGSSNSGSAYGTPAARHGSGWSLAAASSGGRSQQQQACDGGGGAAAATAAAASIPRSDAAPSPTSTSGGGGGGGQA